MLYVIGVNPLGPLKIGISKNPQERLRSLQTGSPHKLHLYASGDIEFLCGYQTFDMPDCAAEKAAHHWYSERRLEGEWFDMDFCFLIEDNGFGGRWKEMTGDCVVKWELTEEGRAAYEVALGSDLEEDFAA